MKLALLIALSLTGTAVAAAVDADRSYTAQAWFPDGTGLEIYTAATGTTHLVSTGGSIGINAGDNVERIVMDKEGYVLFAYQVKAWRTAASEGVTIRIEPIGPESERTVMDNPKLFKLSGPHIPTLAAVREFPLVKRGEAVTLDILYNSASGEKLYDVLRPNTGPSPFPQQTVVTNKPFQDELQFRDIAILNGRPVRAPSGQMSGPVALIYLPGHASYFVALEPSAKYAFQQVGHVERGKLNFTVAGDTVEVVSKTNLLNQDSAAIWVYRDPYTPITTRQRKMSELDNLMHLADIDEADLRSISQTHGPNHPDIARTRNKIADDKKRIADLRAELAQMKWDDAYVQTSSDIDSLMTNR